MRRFYCFYIFFVLLFTPVTEAQTSRSTDSISENSVPADYRNPISDTLRTSLSISYTGYSGDTASAIRGLQKELEALLPATYYKRMTPSAKIVLFNPDNSMQVLHEVNSNTPVTPASVEKMFTTSTILWALGSNYDFTTKLDMAATSRIEAASVIGNVYLRPSGDPTLRLADFEKLAADLRAQGIRQIDGDIVSDLSADDILTPDAKKYFAEKNLLLEKQVAGDTLDEPLVTDIATEGGDEMETPEVSDEEDQPGYFSSSPNFFIDRNLLALRISGASKKGARASVSLYPPINTVRIVNLTTTSAPSYYKKKRVLVRRGKKKYYRTRRYRVGGAYSIRISSSGGENGTPQVITVTGQIPARQDRSLSVPIKDVPLAMAGLLKWKLEQEGIKVAGIARTGTPPANALTQTLAEKRTPLLELLAATNKPSDNFLAEALFRKLSSVADIGSSDPRDRAERMIRSFLNVVDANTTAVNFADGSGLSRDNQVTANCVIDLLRGIRSKPKMYADFVNSLTIAGVDGTLRGRMRGTYAHGNAHGKTGTLNGVTSLGGYVATKDGQLAAYFITMQNFGGGAGRYKQVQDQIVTKLANFSYAEYIPKYSSTPVFEPVTAPGK